jgi:hypothetical protein
MTNETQEEKTKLAQWDMIINSGKYIKDNKIKL